jgi:thioredoxin reductase (NADPH)
VTAFRTHKHDQGCVASQSTRTNQPGVFTRGNLVDHTYRQATAAAGAQAAAALDAERYLAARRRTT